MIQLSDQMLATVRRAARAEQASALKLLQDANLAQKVQSVRGDAMQRLQGGLAESPLAAQRECAAGCSMCCLTVAVDATALEALAIAEYLAEQVDGPRRDAIVERLRKSTLRREQMELAQRQKIRMACAFLDANGLCSIYQSRPLVCAGVFSLSKQACANAYDSEQLDQQQVPLDQPAKLATMGVSGGLQHALVEAGLDGNLYDLHSATFRAVTTPNAAARFFAGEDIFAGCICTDAHSAPRKAPVPLAPARRADKPEYKTTTPVPAPHFLALKKAKQKRQRLLQGKRN